MKTNCLYLGVAVLIFSRLILRGQESAEQRHEMATNQLKRVARDISARCLDDVNNLEDWKSKRGEIRRQLLEMLGLDPLPPRTLLKPTVTGQLDREAYHIDKVVFQSLPGLYVTGNFYVPKGVSSPLPTVLYLCGHSPNRFGAKFNYQDRAAWFAAHGFACLILDTLEFGEIAGIHHGTHNLNLWNWLSLGYTPAGVEVWNAIRALDYLGTRPEVDMKRIGLTGISGGGAMTWYTAAVDERIAVAAPVCSTFTLGSQADHWLAGGQCDCIYYHNTYLWDFPTVGALIAPRPLLILSGRRDSIFPPDGYHAAFQRAKKIYDLDKAPGAASERIMEIDDDVEHSDPPLFLREARQWMQRWLKGDSTPLPDETKLLPRETAEDLACVREFPSEALNFSIQNQLTRPVVLSEPQTRAAWENRRKILSSQLKSKVFRWFPKEKIQFETKVLGTNDYYLSRNGYTDYKVVSFQTEEGVRIRAQLLTPKQAIQPVPLLFYIKRSTDSIYPADTDELLSVLGRYAVLILNTRFTEHAMTPSEFADVERTAAWSGRTIGSMRVWDILRAVEWLIGDQKFNASSISLYGKDEMGVLSLYAALYDERIQQVILNGAPASHWQGPAMLNVLRLTDIGEVAATLAPRRLISLTKLPEEFRYAQAIYKLEQASNQFVRSKSLPEALSADRPGGRPARRQ